MGIRRALVVLGTAVLAACGGGGGGGSGAADDGGSAGATGLVPSAPAPGAVLYEDAAALRPRVDGAVYRYKGEGRDGGGYDNTVTLAAGAGDTVEETWTRPLVDGPETTTIHFKGGRVYTPEKMPAANGKSIDVDIVELRSPVRADDQFTLFDYAYADQDLDEDGRNERLSLAAYVHVVGREQVRLPWGKTLDAVRVDTHVRSTLRYTSPASEQPPMLEIVISRWYAAGIGVVRTRYEQTAGGVPDVLTGRDEVLMAYDGVDTGLGHTPTVAVMGSHEGHELALGWPWGAVAFDTHAVLLTPEASLGDASYALVQLDRRGRRIAYREYVGNIENRVALLKVGGGLRVLRGNLDGLFMDSFDATGQERTGSRRLSADSLYVKEFAAAAADDRVWVLREREKEDACIDQLVQGFDAAGEPLGIELLLQTTCRRLEDYRLSANGAQLVATWVEHDTHGEKRMYAVIDTRTLAMVGPTALPSGPGTGRPLDLGIGNGALWYDAARWNWMGALFDGDGGMRVQGGGLAVEVLNDPWKGRAGSSAAFAAAGGRLFAAHAVYEDIDEPANPDVVFWSLAVDAGTPLAAGGPVLHGRTPRADVGEVVSVLPMGDRAIVIRYRNFPGVMSSVVFMPGL